VAGYSGRTYIPMKRKNGVEEKTRLSREQIFNACESSLERLQTDYLDLYQLHWPDRYTPTFGALSYQRANERDDGIAWDEQVQAMGDLIKVRGPCAFLWRACSNMPRRAANSLRP
jgi:aryl-alcohol dehydrogenase-like predicted oxidoreductase